MSTITNRKITDGQRNAVWVQHQQDRLTGTPQENKSVFDEYAELIREHFNGAMDDIDGALGDVSTDFGQIEERVEALEEINVEDAAQSARAYAESARDYASMVSDQLAEATSYASKHFKMTRSSGEGVPFAEFIFNPYDYAYSADDYYEVFVNGFKLNENEYSVERHPSTNMSIVRLSDPIEETGNVIEVCVTKFLDPATYVAQAQEYAEDAEASREDAEGWAKSAYGYAEQADASVTSISNVEERVRAVAVEVEGYRDDAEESANDAGNYASTASNKATQASESATQAQTYAGNASTSATQAQTYAGNASTSATQASGYATNASTSATSAEDSAQDAEAWAKGTKNGTPVSSSDAQYQNNSKYWAGQAEDLKDATQAIVDEARADVFEAMDGLHEETTAGSALQLISDKYTENKEPYLFRKSIAGDRELDALVGGSVAWNQQIRSGDFSQGTDEWTVYNATMSASDGGVKVVATSAWGTLSTAYYYPTYISGHKYLTTVLAKGESGGEYFALNNSAGVNAQIGTLTTTKAWYSKISESNYTGEARFALFTNNSGVTFYVYKAMVFDLTQMFGTAVADRLYEMEQANAGSGVALFRSWFPKDYYAYNTGELMSVKTTAHEMVGFNQWDEEWELGGFNIDTGALVVSSTRLRSKNFTRALPDTNYYWYCIPSKFTGWAYMLCYDANQQYLGAVARRTNSVFKTLTNTAYIKLCLDDAWGGKQYDHDICISFSSDRNGEYEPYWMRTYQLDPIKLRGIPKVTSDGSIYWDGDKYKADGEAQRNAIELVIDGTERNWMEYPSEETTLCFLKDIFATDSGVNRIPKYILEDSWGICDKLLCIKNVSVSGAPSGSLSTSTANSKKNLYVKFPNGITSLTDFKAWLANNPLHLVYVVENPTIETASPFTSPQIVDAYGTERYVDERTVAVPVGHITKYPDNLREKLDGLPWDFSSLIAPTEKAYTATRNYTAGSLLIVNNILYKVTANIANGGAITPNTNVVATTLSEVISAL